MSNKRKIVLFGNCQVLFLSSLLKASLDSSEYTIDAFLNTARAGDVVEKDIILSKIENCDVLIFQPLNAAHGDFSEDNLSKITSLECNKIKIPYLFNSGILSLCQAPMVATHSYGFIYGQETIIELIKSGLTNEEITNKYLIGDIDFKLTKRFNFCTNELKQREGNLDVILADFILNNKSNVKLFDTHNHPTLSLFCEMLKQINHLAKLKIPHVAEENYSINPLTQTNCPITPYDIIEHDYSFPYDTDWEIKGTELIGLIYAEHAVVHNNNNNKVS
jgi:hypothetical protein